MSLRGRQVDDPRDQQFLDLIAQHGHAIMNVAEGEDERTDIPPFAYSVGAFESYGAPEIILFGFDPDIANAVINDVMADYVEGRRYVCDVPQQGLLGGDYPVIFHEADPTAARAFATFADWYYERQPFPLWQLVWCDRQRRFPWDPGCVPDVKQAQIDLTGGKYWWGEEEPPSSL